MGVSIVMPPKLTTTAIEYCMPLFHFFDNFNQSFVLPERNLKYLIISNRIFEVFFDQVGKIRFCRDGNWSLNSKKIYVESHSLPYMVLLCALKRSNRTKHVNISGNGGDVNVLLFHVVSAFETT